MPVTSAAQDNTKRRSIGSQRNPASEDAILQAAAEILAEGGLASFSIEAVARRARAGKPTIYRWWPSRAALLLDIYHRQKGEAFYADTGNTRQDLILFLEALLGFWRGTGGEVFRSIVAEAQSNPEAMQALREYSESRCSAGSIILKRGQARGDIDQSLRTELLMELFSSFCWNRLLTCRLDVSREDLAHIVDSVVGGFTARKPPQ